MDVIIRLKHKVDDDRQIEEQEKFDKKKNLRSNNIFQRPDVNNTVYHTIYYCECGESLNGEDMNKKVKSNMYITDTHKHTKFNISQDRIYFWDRYSIWMHSIGDVWTRKNKVYIQFHIERFEKETYIKEVRTSSNPLNIAIIVSMSA